MTKATPALLRTRLIAATKSTWSFPLALAAATAVLTVLGVSGTSIGVYEHALFGSGGKDTALLAGHPRAIRSDEWLVWTQLTIAQSRAGYPAFNADVTPAESLALESEVPSKDWSTVFKPQLWPFFVLPLKYAFALKWWALLASLMASSYFLVLRICRPRILVAVLLAIGFGFSPFEMWWYQSTAFLLPTYGFILIILVDRLFKDEPIPRIRSGPLRLTAYMLCIGAVGVLFGLLFYPPFQITIGIVVVGMAVALFLEARERYRLDAGKLLLRAAVLVVSSTIVGLIGYAFIASHPDPIHALANSVYPGHRRTTSGSGSVLRVLDGFVMPLEQSDERGASFFANQSETANFVLLMPFLLLPAFVLLFWERRISGRTNWPFAMVQLLSAAFLARVLIPAGDPIFSLILLNRVPNGRLVIGLGFLGFLQLLYVMRAVALVSGRGNKVVLLATATMAATVAVLAPTALYIARHYPEFARGRGLVLGLAVAFAVVLALFLVGRPRMAAASFAIFALGSTYGVLPLYRGLGAPLYGRITTAIDETSPPSATWVTVGRDAAMYENMALLASRHSLSGVRIYPNVDFWEGVAGPRYQAIYNREGHILFTERRLPDRSPFSLIQPNVFSVRFSCSPFVLHHAQFALSVHPLTEACAHLVRTVKYPAQTFYLSRLAR